MPDGFRRKYAYDFRKKESGRNFVKTSQFYKEAKSQFQPL